MQYAGDWGDIAVVANRFTVSLCDHGERQHVSKLENNMRRQQASSVNICAQICGTVHFSTLVRPLRSAMRNAERLRDSSHTCFSVLQLMQAALPAARVAAPFVRSRRHSCHDEAATFCFRYAGACIAVVQHRVRSCVDGSQSSTIRRQPVRKRRKAGERLFA